MHATAAFESFRTDDPEIFAIRISGHLTPRQKSSVEQIIEKCRELDKRKVLFELSNLESLGGGVAQTLGGFAGQMAAEGKAPCFVGARDIVRKFLRARFKDGEPQFAETVEEACKWLGDASGTPEQSAPSAGTAPGTAPGEAFADQSADEPQGDGESFLKIIDAVTDSATGLGTASAADAVGNADANVPAKPPIDAPTALRFISLEDALKDFNAASKLQEVESTLTRLLHSSMLASRSFLFLRTKDGFRGGDHHFADDGIFATLVERRQGPMDLLDFVEFDLDDDEAALLEELNCQVCMPFFGPTRLEGICFLSKVLVGEEYGAAEMFALEMLSQQVSEALWSNSPVAPVGSGGDQARLVRSLRRVSRQLHESAGAESIFSRLAHGLIGEMGISGVCALQLDDTGLRVTGNWGQGAPESGHWTKVPLDALDDMSGAARIEDLDTDWATGLGQAGCSWFASLSREAGKHRALAIAHRDGADESAIDIEALEAVIGQAGFALAHADALEASRAHTLLVSRTLVSLIEKRIGHESTPETNVVVEYVAHLAERMNVDPQELPDILYGTIMRDVGMIEISDLVLKSPRKLSPEEWRLVQRHPIAGAAILRGMSFSRIAAEVVEHHHERFNGEGYPHGLRGTAIPVGSRMVSVVESFVAMLRETPYRPALSEDEALSVLQENWEMRYDPNVIEQFIALKQTQQSPLDINALLVGQAPA
ncbi:hypothetical protein DRQ53_00760 [bacterium]|nr:MAG: hypothetical protein DRQ32_02705 [bacterium]RKZ18417.1 MAG: hypothetical protein DRQ53_00760 [bacterium]